MTELLEYIDIIEDCRQAKKVKHKLKDIVVIVLFATLAYADSWEDIEIFAEEHEEFLREYIELENGVPSHDTIQRVMGMISPNYFKQIQDKWHELLSKEEGEKIKKIICIDGKTMRGNAGRGQKPNHIVSAWCDEEGFCLGEKKVEEKTNEITAIPELLNMINIKGTVITIDAMGTQVEIAKKIIEKKADYVLALKDNQEITSKEVKEYLEDKEFQEEIKKAGNYKCTIEKSHNQLEKREYYQTDKIKWLTKKEKWKNIKTIGCVKKTIKKQNGEEIEETRYYISSLKTDIELFLRAIRQHWSVEVMHWHLDVTFKEDKNTTLDKIAAENMNIIRKWCLTILKIFEIGKIKALKRKRYAICNNPEKYIRQVLEI